MVNGVRLWLLEKNMDKKEFDERLILEVEANPVLYNKADPFYSDRNKKEQIWKYIGYVLNADVTTCKDRWKNLRDTFSKYYKKEKNVPSGSQAYSKKPWPYFEIMKFLVPNIEVPRTVGNMARGKENSFQLQDDTENSFPTVSCWTSETPSPPARKRKRESDTEKVLAALTQINEPESTPLEKFFLSLAQRASSWTRRKQSKLEAQTLNVFHQIEFEDD
ncbi:transcription factor Adf-1-like [Eupeodes corollae]|uniref:transcription factor Adf-1-like n=1 Tax=Eupeodes corollae TaxID=290404 RepID=UPI00249195EA|nr:transcription factor Adf-1-like [Eupeodes corollae]